MASTESILVDLGGIDPTTSTLNLSNVALRA
jgi:hypothetical protein